jgi:hypothetical protein
MIKDSVMPQFDWLGEWAGGCTVDLRGIGG